MVFVVDFSTLINRTFPEQRAVQQRTVPPGVSEGCRNSRCSRGAGLRSGKLSSRLRVHVSIDAILKSLQVAIKAPNSEDSSYVNKKGFHSVACQLVCDARGLLLSAETHWPGGLHDTEVLERSALYQQLQDSEEGWLLGEPPLHDSLDVPDVNHGGDRRFPFQATAATL